MRSGPAVYVPEDWDAPLEISLTIRDADGTVLFAGETSTARMKRTFTDLVELADPRQPRAAG